MSFDKGGTISKQQEKRLVFTKTVHSDVFKDRFKNCHISDGTLSNNW